MKYVLNERFFLLEENEVSETTKTWEQRYAQCKSQEQFNSFWSTWYKEIFGEHAEEAKKLHTALDILNQEEGWTPEENEILAWVLSLFSTSEGQAVLKVMSALHLDTIKSAAEKGYLLDLENGLNGKLGKYNLLYNLNFYKLSSKDQLAWLDLQNEVQAHFKSKNIENFGKIFGHIYSIAGNPNNPKLDLPANQKLVTITQAQHRVEKLTGKSKNEKNFINGSDIEKMLANVDTNKAKVALIFAFDLFTATLPESIKNLGDKKAIVERFRQAADRGLTYDQVKTALNTLKLPQKTYSTKTATDVMLGLIKKCEKQM